MVCACKKAFAVSGSKLSGLYSIVVIS